MNHNNEPKGPISWMANNSVAANILLFVLMVGGLIKLSGIKQEIFPEFQLDIVTVTVPFAGASPKEVENGIVLPIEEAIRGIDGVKHVNSTATEGFASVIVECVLGANAERVADDIKTAVDQIRTFPTDAERPTTKRIIARSEVISLVIHGDMSDEILRHYADMARDGLLEYDNITLVDLIGAKEREISVEISRDNLVAHDLTLGAIAHNISMASVEVPAGNIKTSSKEFSVRTNDKKDYGDQYEKVVLKSTNSGENLRLNDIAQVKDTFEDIDKFSRYNGQPAIMVKVYRTGEQRPTDIANTVKQYQKKLAKTLPPGLSASVWNDFSKILKDRIDLLVKNALLGLILVFIILGLFLEAKLAFWVTLGIPASFLGAFLFLPQFGVSVNMISLFAFIVTLGMVVDDAIVVGENIYNHRQNGEPLINSSVRGAKQIAAPVVFAVLTTMAAFSPLFFVPGVMGKFFFVIPTIVLLVLVMSLIESLFILPNHLAHSKKNKKENRLLRFVNSKQRVFSDWFMRAVEKYYRPTVTMATQYRYATVAIALSMLIITIGVIAGGRLQFSFMPNMDSDIVLLHAEYPVGQPTEKTKELEHKLLDAADRALTKLGGKEKSLGLYSQIGSTMNPGGPAFGGKQDVGGHVLEIMVYLVSSELRAFSSNQFSHEWQQELGEVPGIKEITFKSTTGPDTGKPVSLLLKHKDVEVLEKSAISLANTLKTYHGLHSIESGVANGKEQIEFKLKDSARALGITSQELGLQVRNSFFGAEALRRQRGRDEVKVMVRLPKKERNSIYDIENFRVQTQNGEVLLQEIAQVKKSISYSEIEREDGIRVLTVSADITEGQANANEVMADLKKNVIPQIEANTPGITISQNGEQREQADSMKSLGIGFIFALIMIYALLAIPLKSYVQPLIIMSAIPFGIIGASLGHIALGYNLSMISMMGIVALAGIVVNDSLVFIHAANELIAQGKKVREAIIDAGVRRFRPILLTSLTTFFGLAPMIMETSLQARFLIPMAISIAFGVIFATAIILVLVPALYVIVFDIKSFVAHRSAEQNDDTKEIYGV